MRNRESSQTKRKRIDRGKRECRDPKKIPAHLYASTRLKCEAMKRLDSRYSVRKMCKVLGVGEKQYCQWRIQEENRTGRRLEEFELVQRIEEAFHASDDAYGCRKIMRELRIAGIAVSEWKVRRIMRQHGFYSVTQRKYKPYRHHQETNPYQEDLVKQNFRPEAPNVV